MSAVSKSETESTARSWGALVAFFLVVAIAGSFGAISRPGAWYQSLDKAPWNPPPAVFAPVWTVLYVAIAVAGWLVWRGSLRDRVIVFWIASVIFNAAWTTLFFGAQKVGLALADMLLMLCAIVAFIGAAWPIDKRAAWLFVPYALWVTYATSLTVWILAYNR